MSSEVNWMFSILDHQTGDFLHSGRNSKSESESVEDGLYFLIGHDSKDEESWTKKEHERYDEPTWTEAKKLGYKKYLELFEFEVVEHSELI